MKTITIIPSRLSATRLPGKPLLKINDLSIISHVFRKAQEANLGEVFVATEDQEIVDDVTNNGGNAILTSRDHKTGTDRIYEALKKKEATTPSETTHDNMLTIHLNEGLIHVKCQTSEARDKLKDAINNSNVLRLGCMKA
mgnify:CR=1 FL=1